MRGAYRRLLALVGALVIGLTACGGGAGGLAGGVAIQAQPAVAGPTIGLSLPAEVTPERVAELYDTGQIAVIDVREMWEYEQGHIPGATLIPLDSLAGRLDEIPRDQPVVLVCRSSNRSGQAHRMLVRQGFDNVSNMLGGMLEWEAAGYDISR
jgi:rhodanese-related sulfurtransferase